MDIEVTSDNPASFIDVASVENLVRDFLTFHQVSFDAASVHFVDTPTICQLHSDFFDDPSPTDCISFPMDDAEDEGYRVLGEVFVCPETASDYVRLHGGNMYEEITLYTVHGLLHLLGYDDIEEEERLIMRAEEARYLAHVSAKNLWIRVK
jgi:probable rRNA maturation factor